MILRNVYGYAPAAAELYRLLKERSTEADPHVNISHRKLPGWYDHLTFVMSEPYECWYLIHTDHACVGSISITDRNEIGIVLFIAHRGKGYGYEALAMLLKKHRPLPAVPSYRNETFIANINPNNARSIRLFKSAGFELLQHTYALKH